MSKNSYKELQDCELTEIFGGFDLGSPAASALYGKTIYAKKGAAAALLRENQALLKEELAKVDFSKTQYDKFLLRIKGVDFKAVEYDNNALVFELVKTEN
ncbi:MAG: hypothetical protein Q4E33_05375 [Erysipelotrichaceae bacterium]|nr:hypothetical protein [Erysipelotrichaceae bacterium]